jgi:hypothetical protein
MTEAGKLAKRNREAWKRFSEVLHHDIRADTADYLDGWIKRQLTKERKAWRLAAEEAAARAAKSPAKGRGRGVEKPTKSET